MVYYNDLYGCFSGVKTRIGLIPPFQFQNKKVLSNVVVNELLSKTGSFGQSFSPKRRHETIRRIVHR